MPDVNAKGLPRVLLIGDSIARGYGKQVEQKLKGKAYVARLATSKSVGDPALLAEVALVLGQAVRRRPLQQRPARLRLHRGRLPQGLPRVDRDVEESDRQGAKLIWATTTPVRPARATSTGLRPPDRSRPGPQLHRRPGRRGREDPRRRPLRPDGRSPRIPRPRRHPLQRQRGRRAGRAGGRPDQGRPRRAPQTRLNEGRPEGPIAGRAAAREAGTYRAARGRRKAAATPWPGRTGPSLPNRG